MPSRAEGVLFAPSQPETATARTKEAELKIDRIRATWKSYNDFLSLIQIMYLDSVVPSKPVNKTQPKIYVNVFLK